MMADKNEELAVALHQARESLAVVAEQVKDLTQRMGVLQREMEALRRLIQPVDAVSKRP
jgi:hypothetical protein